jgi:Protein of unknown function (DUF3108)
MLANCKRTHFWPGANAIAAALALALVAVAPGLHAASPLGDAGNDSPFGLRSGESITYSVRWGFIPSVGRIRISAKTEGSGDQAVLRVTTDTWTWGIARGLFAFDAKGESLYSLVTGKLMSSTESSTYQNKTVKNGIVMDYATATAKYTDEVRPEKSRTLSMPPGDPSDLILALIQTRSWNLKPGEKRDTLVVFEDQFYPLTITAEDTDTVYTGLGIFNTIVLVPRMEKSPPIGMFRKGGMVRVWIETDDSRHLPVRFSVGFRVGTGTATLIDYQPPK